MKRPGSLRSGPGPRRSREIARGSGPRTSRSSLPKVNARQQAKKKATYKAFLSSAVWKRMRREALERAGHRCEARHLFFVDLGGLGAKIRCPETEKLTVHHKTYARFGGGELPEDLEVRCKQCHDHLHALEGKRIA